MNINKKVGERIRINRESQGFSQEAFASNCGISRAYYGRIERGEHSLTIEKCYIICQTLGISFSELFQDIEKD